jgi:hypothetical protein
MSEYTPLQLRLMRIRDERCGGNAAELARRIKKDATYVNRLFYPAGKPGAKGIGLEIMAACTEAFGLHPGYWDGLDALGAAESSDEVVDALTDDERDLIEDFRVLPDEDQTELRLEIGTKATKARAYLQKTLTSMGLLPPTKDSASEPAPQPKSTVLLMSTRHNVQLGSDSDKGSSEAVQPRASKIKTPALDEEDARHRGDDGYEGSKHRGPGRPENA